MVNRWTHCCSCQVVGAGVHGPQRLLEVYNHNEVGWSSQLLHTCSGHSGTHRGSSAYSMPLVVQCYKSQVIVAYDRHIIFAFSGLTSSSSNRYRPRRKDSHSVMDTSSMVKHFMTICVSSILNLKIFLYLASFSTTPNIIVPQFTIHLNAD